MSLAVALGTTMKTTDLSFPVAFTAGAAAEAAGLPRCTVDYAIQQGDLPAAKSGRRLIVLREDLMAWLRRCRDKGNIPTPVSDADRERLAELNRNRQTNRNPA